MKHEELLSTIQHQIDTINDVDNCYMYAEILFDEDTRNDVRSEYAMKFTYSIADRISAEGSITSKNGRDMLLFVTSILTEALTESGIVEKAGEETYGKRMH